MTQLIPFESSNRLPARFANRKAEITAPSWALGGGFPAISVKGKVFTIVRGDERTLVTQPGDDEAPASSLEVVILKAGNGTSKVFYTEAYVEGSDAKPNCYSNDGKAPAADAADPQATNCATCAHNQWGSRITTDGKKAKACADSVRLAVAPAGNVNDAMLLRVPATSIAALREHFKKVAGRGMELHDVVTKIGFDYTVAHPALTFRAVGIIPDELIGEVLQAARTDLVGQIIGEIFVEHAPEPFEAPAPKVVEEPKPVAAPAPAEKPKTKKSSALASAEAAAKTEAPAKVKVEAAVAAESPAKNSMAALEAELEGLDDLDFED